MGARVELRWFAGTVEVRGLVRDGARAPADLSIDEDAPPGALFDERERLYRAPAAAYARIVLWLRDRGAVVDDQARKYLEIPGAEALPKPRPFQTEALHAWKKAQGRGVVVLPTGAGKTVLALMAIDDKKRSTLVIAPTLDLVRQWHQLLREAFGVDVGVIGGGEHTVLPLTVSTYDSAWTHMEHYGNRFGMVVFDEAHHLVAESYALAAKMCLAPYRLGLTATPERTDGRDALLFDLVGPIAYRKEIDELEGTWLSEYDTETVEIELSDDDKKAWTEARAVYKAFLSSSGVSLAHPRGWTEFIKRAARSAEGRQALAAYRRQKGLAFAAPGKLVALEEILARHNGARTLIFTDDNATAYAVARRFLVPVITHQTKVRERSALLASFASGALPVLATSRVLNEGIDVPDAQVAVIVSGTGSVREHVQRLGRILRRREGKRAVLYELVTKDTGEGFTSERRRQHVAYR